MSLHWRAVISTLETDWLCVASCSPGDGPQRKQKAKGEGAFFILEVVIEPTYRLLNGRGLWALGFEALLCVSLTTFVGL